MSGKKISCAYCGSIGQIGIGEADIDVGLLTFEYLGHNPLSGHMHFQCPVCKVVSLINPISVLKDDLIHADFGQIKNKSERKLALFQIFKKKIKIFNDLFCMVECSRLN